VVHCVIPGEPHLFPGIVSFRTTVFPVLSFWGSGCSLPRPKNPLLEHTLLLA